MHIFVNVYDVQNYTHRLICPCTHKLENQCITALMCPSQVDLGKCGLPVEADNKHSPLVGYMLDGYTQGVWGSE